MYTPPGGTKHQKVIEPTRKAANTFSLTVTKLVVFGGNFLLLIISSETRRDCFYQTVALT